MSQSKKKKRSKKDKKESSVTEKSNFYEDVDYGVDLIWNNQFEEAETFFGKKSSKIPRMALHYAEVPVLRSFITEGENDRVAGISRLLASIELAEEHIKILEKGKLPSDVEKMDEKELKNRLLDTRIVLADSYILLAAMQVLNESRIKGAINLRRGWKLYEASLPALESDEEYDPKILSALQFGAGLFYMVVSLIPPGFSQKVAQLAGFKANKKLGLEYLRSSHKSNSVRSSFAGIVLSINHLLLSPGMDKKSSLLLAQEADEIISIGISKFPQGSLFQVTKALCDMEKGKLTDAIESFEVAIANSRTLVEHPPIFYRALSNCYLMCFRWEEAINLLEKLVELHQDEKRSADSAWAGPWHLVKLGGAYQMTAKKKKSMELFEEASKVKNTDKFSVYIARLANRYVNNGGHLSTFELLHLTGHFDKLLNNVATKETKEELLEMVESAAKQSKGALENNLKEKIPLPKKGGMLSLISFGYLSNGSEMNQIEIDNRVSYLTLKASVLRSLGKQDEAITLLREVIEDLKDHLVDKMYLAFGMIEMGKCLARDDVLAALKQFHNAMKLSDYPWEEQVKQRLRVYMNQLGVDTDNIESQLQTKDEEFDDEMKKHLETEKV